MTPFYFGSSGRRLFGVYEPAAMKGAGARAAVLCYPWGSEYLHAHRTMRQLAIKLSVTGFHTLRFDLFGTGDSAGEMTDADTDGWEADIESAMEEITSIVGATRVTLIGLRLGATLAASVATRRGKDIDALVLWDPIVSGRDYARHLAAAAPQGFPNTGQVLEVSGFPLTTALLRDFQSLDLGSLLAPSATRTLMLVTERSPAHGAFHAVPTATDGGSLAIEFMTAMCPWVADPESVGMVPIQVLQRIVGWLG